MENKLLTCALDYWDKGISIFPLVPNGKIPLTDALPICDGKRTWIPFQTERASRERVIEWWTKYPNANIAGVMGEISGVICVDQDIRKDEKGLPIFDASGQPIQRGDIDGFPATLSATTWSGGKHLIYKYISGVPLRVGVRELLDIKSSRSYIVLAPSIINGKAYAWDMDWKEMWDALAPFPIEVLQKSSGGVFGPKLNIIEHVGVEHGGRNNKMHKLACSFYAKGFTDEEVISLANAVNQTYKPPIGEHPEDKPGEFMGILQQAKKFIFNNNQRTDRGPWIRGEWRKENNGHYGKSQTIIERLSDIPPVSFSWLWPGRIAFGKLTLIVGDPNVGKSLLFATIAATASTGHDWPVDKTPSPVVDVILLSAEDDAADTIRPRLDAVGADCKRIHILQCVRHVNPDGSPAQHMFSLKHDLAALEETLSSLPECKLVMIDPISAYLDDTDSHRNAAIRGLLAPLSALAAKRKIAVVVIDHLNKNSRESNMLYRPGGSLAFVAAARAAYLVTLDKENRDRRLFIPIKNNIAKETTGLAYVVVTAENGAPIIAWEPEPLERTAYEALAVREQTLEQTTATDEAIEFLKALLSKGPVGAREATKNAKQVGITDKPLRDARKKLGIVAKKPTFTGGWEWDYPEDALYRQGALPKAVGILGNQGHLGNKTGEEAKAPEKMSGDKWFKSLPP